MVSDYLKKADVWTILDLICAEFTSDPRSTQCFDRGIVERAIELSRDHGIEGPCGISLKPSDCPHADFQASVSVHRFLDTGKFMADVLVRCARCGEPFRFVGVPSGLDFERPMCSIDGLELRAPIEPQIEAKLHAAASFHVPKAPERH